MSILGTRVPCLSQNLHSRGTRSLIGEFDKRAFLSISDSSATARRPQRLQRRHVMGRHASVILRVAPYRGWIARERGAARTHLDIALLFSRA
jgi:hypothetical protein